MDPNLDANALAQMTRDELIVALLRAREEINDLKAELGSCRSGVPSPAAGQVGLSAPIASSSFTNPTPEYTVSLNVLNITGNPRQRLCKSVPLQEILSRNFAREDEREADTPIATGAGGRFSGANDIGRFSGFSVNSEGEGMQLPEGLSPLGNEGRLSFAGGNGSSESPELGTRESTEIVMTSSLGALGQRRSNRPAPLLHVAGPLDSNAILSQHTLHAFARMGNTDQARLSPRPAKASAVMHYVMDVFARNNDFQHDRNNSEHIEGFGRTLVALCAEVENVLKQEPAHPTVTSPAFVFGDIHGNFRDLHYFTTQLMNFDDLRFSPYRFVFLGDYVDRGDFSVECVAFLFALKVLAPHKVTLLRGNHEDTLVNGDVNLYRDTSFRSQARALFGEFLGEQVWDRCNGVFTNLPLSANIDGKIFCTHGGVPQFSGGEDTRMNFLTEKLPKMRSFFEIPANESEAHKRARKAATDVCWSDPAEEESRLDKFGFGANPRGNGVILFGSRAVDQFCAENGFEYIFRAHQEKSDGLKISKNARVITIFSTSAYVGHQNGAGCVYVGDGRIRLIVKERDTDLADEEYYD